MKKQLKLLGLSIDWEKEFLLIIKIVINTSKNCSLIFKKGTVSRKETYVNWDPLKTLFLPMNRLLMAKDGDLMLKFEKSLQWFLISLNFLAIF